MNRAGDRAAAETDAQGDVFDRLMRLPVLNRLEPFYAAHKEMLLYLLFGGIYPIFKAMFERLHYIVAWVLKLSCFNTMLTMLIFCVMFMLVCKYISV